MNIHGRIFINPSCVVPCCSFVEFHVERERIDICARTFVHTYTHADRIIVKQTIGNKRHSWMNDALEKLVRSDDAFGIAWFDTIDRPRLIVCVDERSMDRIVCATIQFAAIALTVNSRVFHEQCERKGGTRVGTRTNEEEGSERNERTVVDVSSV